MGIAGIAVVIAIVFLSFTLFRTFGTLYVQALPDYMQQEIESNKTRLEEVLTIRNNDAMSYQAPRLAEALEGAYERRNWDTPPDHVYSADISMLDYNSIVSLLEKENPSAKVLFVNQDGGIINYDGIYYLVHITRR